MILLAGWPAAAGAACSATPACLEATFPAPYAWGALDAGARGTKSAEQVITVTSNEPWGVRVASDLADGRMKEWDGTGYVTASPKSLVNPLEWTLTRIDAATQPLSFTAFSSTAASMLSEQPSTCATTCATAEIGVQYRQVVSYADAAAGVNDYRIDVIYEAGQGF
jgi:hypothetical protein